MANIIVLGSINMDLVVSADRAPESGETLSGTGFQTIPGGKGANQAVAVARQGGDVAMIARVGDDAFGGELIGKLAENKVDITQVIQLPSTSTGVALIVVENNGQNRIIIVAGANGHLKPEDVAQASDLFDQCDFLVAQLEVPEATVAQALSIAREKGIKTVLNAAPAPKSPFGEDILKQVDYLVVNETEAQAMSGMPVHDPGSAYEAARKLQQRSDGTVILTMGEQGAVTADRTEIWHTPAFKVEVKDTTAAGDGFIGGLVAQLQMGNPLKEAVVHASAAGALAATKFGAQPSLPSLQETVEFIANRMNT